MVQAHHDGANCRRVWCARPASRLRIIFRSSLWSRRGCAHGHFRVLHFQSEQLRTNIRRRIIPGLSRTSALTSGVAALLALHRTHGQRYVPPHQDAAGNSELIGFVFVFGIRRHGEYIKEAIAPSFGIENETFTPFFASLRGLTPARHRPPSQ